MKTYLLSIFSERLLNEELSKIINDNSNIIYIDYDESNIDNVMDECAYFSLLNESKTVIVKNFKLNASSKPLEQYLDNPNPNTKLILITNTIDKRNSIYKKIKDKGIVIEINDLKDNELVSKINNYCKLNNISINTSNINKLIEYNLNNYDLILNEIDKMSIITKDINDEVIENYSSKLNGEDTFSFCDAITSKNYKKENELIEKYIIEKLDVIPLVVLLANQYRIIYAVKELKGTNEEIGSLLEIHPYRVKLARDKSNLYSKAEIESILLDLCELDQKLKSMNVNQYSLLKEFLVKIK